MASVVNAAGSMLGTPAPRDTLLPAHAVRSGVAPHEMKVRLNLQQLLQMS